MDRGGLLLGMTCAAPCRSALYSLRQLPAVAMHTYHSNPQANNYTNSWVIHTLIPPVQGDRLPVSITAIMENTPRLVTGAETEIRANLVIVKEARMPFVTFSENRMENTSLVGIGIVEPQEIWRW